MANKPTHAMSLVTKYKDRNGEEKNKFTRVASGRQTDNGNVFYELPKGMLIAGTILCGPIKEKDGSQQSNHAESDELPNDDLPF